MKVKIEGVEIRGHEVKESKKENGGKYVVVRAEDETGKAFEVIDREMERQPFYKRGTVGDLYCDLKIGKDWARLNVVDFKIAPEGA